MHKPFTPEQIRSMITAMQADSRFNANVNELIIQQARLSRLEKEIDARTITDEDKKVGLNRLFYALEELAKIIGIENFLEFVGLQDQSS